MRIIVDELASMQEVEKGGPAFQIEIVDRMQREAEEISRAALQKVDDQIHFIDTEIERLGRLRATIPVLVIRADGGETLSQRLQRSVMLATEIEMRRQEKQYLLAARVRVDALLHQRAAREKVERLRLDYLSSFTAWQNAFNKRAAIKANRTMMDKILHAPTIRQQNQNLDSEVNEWERKTNLALSAFRSQKKLVEALPTIPAFVPMMVDRPRLDALLEPLRHWIEDAKALANHNLLWRAYMAVKPLLGVAAGVLAAWVLVPAAIRTFFYFVLAPLAARRRPIVIDPKAGNAGLQPDGLRKLGDGSLISAVSKRITLVPGQEMLIRPEYCQSQPEWMKVDTKVLFDWSHLLPSVAAHLWMLNQLRTTQKADIVVSSTIDPLDEVALLDIAAGEAFVLQARGIVGVLYQQGQKPRIRSHWRLGTLHAWLTLQLRYLSFQGPATLIVKGCRGVRLESASTGRTISQDATLGFSANTAYSTVRGKPFIPYLFGRQALLHDKFAGRDACYLYEETPRNARPGAHKHNPLEVLIDAGLKAFGI